MYPRFDSPRQEILPAYIENLYIKSKSILNQHAIKPEDFVGFYRDQSIEDDLLYVEGVKTNIEKHDSPEDMIASKYAKIFEAIIHLHGSQGKWFGPHAQMLKASEYDDIKNGVDSIVEFQPPKQPVSQLALALDVTYANDLRKKFDRIQKEINEGVLTEIKYFNSEKTGFKGRKSKVPRVVIGANINIVKGLANLWANDDSAHLATHPIQHVILKEAMIQAESFAAYAHKVGRDEISEIYLHNLSILEEIYKSKRDRSLLLAEEDLVFKTIQTMTGGLK